MGWRITVKAGRVRDMKNKRRKTGKKRGGAHFIKIGDRVKLPNSTNKEYKVTKVGEYSVTLNNNKVYPFTTFLSPDPSIASAIQPAAPIQPTTSITLEPAIVSPSVAVPGPEPAVASVSSSLVTAAQPAAVAAANPTSSTVQPNIIIKNDVLDQNNLCIALDSGHVIIKQDKQNCIGNACLYYAINNLVNDFSNNSDKLINLINFLIDEHHIEPTRAYLEYAEISNDLTFVNLINWCLIFPKIIFVSTNEKKELCIIRHEFVNGADIIACVPYLHKDPLPWNWTDDSLSVVALVRGLRRHNEKDEDTRIGGDHFIAIKIQGNNVHIADSFDKNNDIYKPYSISDNNGPHIVNADRVPIDRTKDPDVKTIIDGLFRIRKEYKAMLPVNFNQPSVVSPSAAAAVDIPPATSSPTSSSTVPPSAIPNVATPLISSQTPAAPLPSSTAIPPSAANPNVEATPVPASASAAPLSGTNPFPKDSVVKYTGNKTHQYVVKNYNVLNPNKRLIAMINPRPDEKVGEITVDITELIPVPIPVSSSTSSTLTAATSGISVPEPVLGTAQGSTSTNPITGTNVPTPHTATAATSGTIVPRHMRPTEQHTYPIIITNPIKMLLPTSASGTIYSAITTNKSNKQVQVSITTNTTDDGNVTYNVTFTDKEPEVVVPSGQSSMIGLKQEPLPVTSHVPPIIQNITKYKELLTYTMKFLEDISTTAAPKRKEALTTNYNRYTNDYPSDVKNAILEYAKKERIAKIKEEQQVRDKKRIAAKAAGIFPKRIEHIDAYLNDFGIIGIWDSINSTLNDICKDLSKIGRIDTDPPKFFGKNRQQYSRYIDEIAPYIASLNTKGTIYNQCQKILTESKDKKKTIDNLKELSKILHELFMILNTFKETYSDNSLTLKINNDALKSTLTHLKESNNSNNNTFLKNMITEIMQDQRPTEIIHKDNIEVIHIQKFLEKYLTIIITKIDAYFKVEDTKITEYIEKQLKFAQQKNAHTKSKLINYLKRVNPTTQSNINEVDGNIKWLNNPSNHTYNELRKKLEYYREKYPMPEKVAVSSVDKQVA